MHVVLHGKLLNAAAKKTGKCPSRVYNSSSSPIVGASSEQNLRAGEWTRNCKQVRVSEARRRRHLDRKGCPAKSKALTESQLWLLLRRLSWTSEGQELGLLGMIPWQQP